jgi:hypothetical protein
MGVVMKIYSVLTKCFDKESIRSLVAGLSSCILLLLSACSQLLPHSSNSSLLQSGVVAISRPIPLPIGLDHGRLPQTESIPVAAVESVIISRVDETITTLNSDGKPIVFRAEGTARLKPGAFTITAKEEHPLWYAPSTYFEKRLIQVPKEGSRDRFRRAALGNKALFLNNSTPIHSGPIWMEEIGGLRITRADMPSLFAMLDIGTRVEVR